MNEKLTIEDFNLLFAGYVFAKGATTDNNEGCNIANTGRTLHWVAKTGFNYDWCIYIHFDNHSFGYVEQYGDKVTSEKNIRKLVPCTDEVFRKYRY
jgi:hypothetical protein